MREPEEENSTLGKKRWCDTSLREGKGAKPGKKRKWVFTGVARRNVNGKEKGESEKEGQTGR